MIPRSIYLDRIRPFLSKEIIKVVTGIRRSGKSTILALIRDELIANGVPEERILTYNFELLSLAPLTTAETLHGDITSRMTGDGMYYVLLDEIQIVRDWEKAVNSLFASKKVDLVLTGSNSHLLSGELATYLAGRYVAFEIQTLSFQEYCDFAARDNRDLSLSPSKLSELFDGYLHRGGFPAISALELETEPAMAAVRDIYTSILLRDTVERKAIRHPELLSRIVSVVFD
jgi:predicted AAA+ superfamily ATPase